jgi:hypothetical protein
MVRSLNHIVLLLALLFFGPLNKSTEAQFIHFQMEVEPELRASVVQNLEFGDVITGTGVKRIEKGSPEMGIFEIRSLSNQHLVVNLNPPSHLTHTDPEIDQQIPLSIEASYTNTGNENIDEAQPFMREHYARFLLSQTGNTLNNPTWQSAFVYIYGEINIGEVPGGTYDGSLVMTVEYQ